MSTLFETRLRRLADLALGRMLARGLKGLEKECLRVTPGGRIAQTRHPAALGSALTHPYITTDYSEALLEFRTPPCKDATDTLDFLTELHQFAERRLGGELLWASSMPCELQGEESIPIAQYGSSNVGRMKHVYRRGLAYRYGRAMQAIAGVHFNYSLPEEFWPIYKDLEGDPQPLQDFISSCYFALVRNLQRWGWIIPYLFGASPAFSKSFLTGPGREFEQFDAETLYRPDATSLRMSDIGYKNSTQSSLNISYNSLAEYVAGLAHAIGTPYPDYERIGIKVDGEYRQLNTHILQIENEYYSFVRPKQIAASGERPTAALTRRGVKYVEVRALDVQAYDPIGVNLPQLLFLEGFLLMCLFSESPSLREHDRREFERNELRVAARGREPGLILRDHDQARVLAEWAADILARTGAVCAILDEGDPESPYTAALNAQRHAVASPGVLPSARMLAEMRQKRESFLGFSLRLSNLHAEYFKQLSLPGDRSNALVEAARQSLLKQREMEAADRISFDKYLQRYFSH
ncbi:MAG: glutamate--cysteine ligase [Gammaproteobacteria bacterium]